MNRANESCILQRGVVDDGDEEEEEEEEEGNPYDDNKLSMNR